MRSSSALVDALPALCIVCLPPFSAATKRCIGRSAMTKTKTKAKTKEPEDSHPGGVSRRSFARGAALAGAAAALLPAHLLAQAQSPASTPAACAEDPPEPAAKLSPASQAGSEGNVENSMLN